MADIAPTGSGSVRRTVSFAATSAALAIVFGASVSAIPLYNVYQQAFQLGTAQFAVLSVGYMLAAVTALLVLGRLSDYVGRKPVAFASIGCGLLACVLLVIANGFEVLLLARALQGFSAGLATTAILAFIVDVSPGLPRWLTSSVTGAAATLGQGIGVLLSGTILASTGVVDVPPEVFIVLLIAAAVAIALSRDANPKRAGALRSLKPELHIPLAVRHRLLPAAAVLLATWGIAGYFQSFTPTIAAQYFGSSSALVAAALFAAFMIPTIGGGAATSRLSPPNAQLAGLLLVIAGAVGMFTAIHLHQIVLYALFAALAGLGMGAGISASMQSLLPPVDADKRGGLLGVIYVISYLGAAAVSFAAGHAATWGLDRITAAYAGLALIAIVIVLTTRRQATTPTTTPRQSTEPPRSAHSSPQ